MLKPIIGLLLALLWALPAQAADPVYEVEMIVFAHTFDPASNGGEDASLSTHRPALDSGFSLDMLGGLPLDNLQLGNTVARLKADPGYQVLLHQAWRQPVGTSATAPWLRVTAGSIQSEGESLPELDGLVRLYRAPYLFMETDLLLRRMGISKKGAGVIKPLNSESQYAGSTPNSDAQTPTTATATPVLKEIPFLGSNRLMEGQLVYFDGPVLSVLVQAKPIKG